MEGEEKTLESVQSEIAKILLAQGAQKSMAKKQAEAILTKVKSSGDLNAEIIAYNATLNTASGVKSIELKETGAITLDGLLADNIEGLGRNAIAAFNLLNEINAIDMTNRVATVANIDDQWVALVLKEKITEDEANRSSARQKQYLSSLKQAKKEFFGDRWLRYALVGPLSYDVLTQFPSEILSTLTSDIGISYFGGKEGSVDQILKSSAYQDQIIESADVKAFFNN